MLTARDTELSIRLESGLKERLRKYAGVKGMTMGQVVREAVKEKLAGWHKAGTFYAGSGRKA